MFINKILFFISIIVIKSDGRIINSVMDGLHDDMEGPITSDLEENVPGTTVSVYGQKDKNTYIVYKNEKNDILFMFAPNCASLYHATIYTEEKGFRIFCNGDEVGYFKSRLIQARTVTVFGKGIYKITIAQDEPVWAINQFRNNGNVSIEDFGENGISVPIMFPILSNKINVNDYFVFTGKKDNRTEAVVMELSNDKLSMIHLMFRIKTGPFFSMKSLNGDIDTYKEIIDMPLMDTVEDVFTVAVAAEHNGWKIYFNGEEVHFFYDRFNKNATVVKFSGANEKDQWTLLKYIHFFKE